MEARCDVLSAYHVVFITANNVKRTRYEPNKKMCFFLRKRNDYALYTGVRFAT